MNPLWRTAPFVLRRFPGVLVELQFDGPKGRLRLRLGVAKPSVEEAMGALLDWALAFALKINQPRDGE